MKKYYVLLATLIFSATFAVDLVFGDEPIEPQNQKFVIDITNQFQTIDLQFGENIDATIGFNRISNSFEINRNLDLKNNQLLNFRIENRNAHPTCDDSQTGRTYFNTIENGIFVCLENHWKNISESNHASTPYINNLQPNIIQKNSTKKITLSGTNFEPDTTIQIPDFTGSISNTVIHSPEKITFLITSDDQTQTYPIIAINGKNSSQSFVDTAPQIKIINNSILSIKNNLVLWIDANLNETFTTNNNKILTITEQSDQKFVATQTDTNKQPMLIQASDGSSHMLFNGNQSVAFNGNNNFQLTDDMTLFIVKKSTAVNDRRNMIHKNYASELSITNESNGSYSWYWGNSAYGQIRSNIGTNIANKRDILMFARNLSKSPQGNISKNGQNALLPGSGGNTYIPRNSTSPLIIGDGYVHGFIGEINEIILYNRDLSLEEKNEVTQYLTHKWDIID